MKNFITLFAIIFFLFLLAINISLSDPSRDLGWTELNTGTTQTLTSVCSQNLQTVWVCGYGGTVLRSTNYAVLWNNVSGNGIPSAAQLINIVSYINGNVALTAGYIGTNTYVYRTSNSGATWTQVFTEVNGFINALYINFDNNELFMTGDPVGGRWSLWKSTDEGISWDSSGMYLPQEGAETGWNNSLYGVYNNIWFGTNNSRVYYSTDFGSSWTVQPTTGEINTYSIWFYNYSIGLIGGTSLQETTNSGSIWLPQNSPGTGNIVGVTGGPGILNNNSTIPRYRFYARSNKIYIYDNNYPGWSEDYTAPSGLYRYLASDYYGYFCFGLRDNGGISLLGIPVGIEQTQSEIPNGFSLGQNYPNPFNPVTLIEFGIPESGFTSLKVYDANGKEVKTIVNEYKSTGIYKAEFNGNGNSSGIYFYKLISGNYRETRSMVLLK